LLRECPPAFGLLLYFAAQGTPSTWALRAVADRHSAAREARVQRIAEAAFVGSLRDFVL